MDDEQQATYQFCDYRLIPGRRQVIGGDGQPVAMRGKAFDLLYHLVQNRGRLVEKSELLAALWPSAVVEENNLNQAMSALRQALGESTQSPRFIATVTGRGYQFIAAVQVLKENETQASTTDSDRVPLRATGLMLGVAALGIAVFLLRPDLSPSDVSMNVIESPRIVRATRTVGTPVVAVLPFTFASVESDGEFFANGIHDALLTQLAQLQSIRVISRTSVLEYRNTVKKIPEIGNELGADAILEGGVQVANDQIRINAQLIGAESDEHLWAHTYNRQLSAANIFEVQTEIARAITTALDATLTAQDSKQLTLIPTENMAAYRAFHRALRIGETDGRQAPEYLQALEEAVALDPTFSRAWAELVTNLAFLNIVGDNPDATLRAEQALQNLQAVAPGSADYRIAQAGYVYYVLKDYDRAHDLVSQALTMNPSDVWAVELRSWIERRQGDFDAFVESAREARKLDPRNPLWTDRLLNRLIITHRYDEAWVELESSPLESFATDYTRSRLLFREHREFQRWQESMDRLCQSYERTNCGWNARVANRDYPGALDALGQMKDGFDRKGLSPSERRRILTYWLMKDGARLTEGLPQWQIQLETDRDDSGDFRRNQSNIGSAMLAGIAGRMEESERLIQRFFRLDPIDWADRVGSRHEACRVLGMIEASDAAVKCIRDGLQEASFVVPFSEPYLPFYDSMRDDPAFIEMLVEIDPEAPAMTVH